MNHMRKRHSNSGERGDRNGGGDRGRPRHSRGRYRDNRHGSNNGGQQNDHQALMRQKKHAQSMREKYENMAKDAQRNGDRVDVEYYLQHVDHYVRVLAEIAELEPQRPEYHAEPEAEEAAAAPSEESAGNTVPMTQPAAPDEEIPLPSGMFGAEARA